MGPRLEIHYCPRCRWLPRASWLAQELLSTFGSDLGEVALVPAGPGVFRVVLAGATIFSRESAGRLPDSKELKRLVRDRVAPDRDLGHVDGDADGPP
jgi:selenoprotein W-related protein